MILIVGLGNPGNEYLKTRHNVGHMAIDYLVSRHNFFYKQKKKLHAQTASGEIFRDTNTTTRGDNLSIILAKPTTYMNLSGNSVAAIANFYKINPNNIFIIHDDADLELGRIKIKQGGSSGGHNGLKSIDQMIGTNYYRLRIGIGKSTYGELSDFVLGKFTEDQCSEIMKSLIKIGNNLPLLLNRNIEGFKKIITEL